MQKYGKIIAGDSSLSFLNLSLFLFFVFVSSYKKTHETLSHAGHKATAAISNVGTAISKKFGDMRYKDLLLLCSFFDRIVMFFLLSLSFPPTLVF